jgi:hypothetical protein
MGVGGTLAAAERDLLENAEIVTRVYGKMSPSTLDHEALRMYHFALRVA